MELLLENLPIHRCDIAAVVVVEMIVAESYLFQIDRPPKQTEKVVSTVAAPSAAAAVAAATKKNQSHHHQNHQNLPAD